MEENFLNFEIKFSCMIGCLNFSNGLIKILWRKMFFVCLFFKIIYLFIYLWLCWVFVSVRGPSPVAASRGHSSSRCVGLSLSRPLLLRSTVSRRAGSAIVAHRPSCSAACGILPDQGSNPCSLHGRQTLNHCATREAPRKVFLKRNLEGLPWWSSG